MRTFLAVALCLVSTTALAKPTERRLHSDSVEANTFLWNDSNKFVENYHPNYVADDDPATAWVEGSKGSGAGEWLRINVSPLDRTTKIRLRVRNGYQKSKELFKANARAKEVVVRLLPTKHTMKVTLDDELGWQEIVVDQPSGEVGAVEINVMSVYEGSKYADLCISDVQVFATSEFEDNPAFEKTKRVRLMQWRSARLAAAKLFAGRTDLPIYSGYAITATDSNLDFEGGDLAAMVTTVAGDPVFAKEWKDALAIAKAVTADYTRMRRVQIAPRTNTRLVAVDGVDIPDVAELVGYEGPYLAATMFRLPMLGTVASMFADQLRVADIKDKLTIGKFEETSGRCKDTMWALRKESKETAAPSQVQALVMGRCGRVQGRGGYRNVRVLELVVFDTTGKAALVVGYGHVEGYRWAIDNGKPMIVGARSLVYLDEKIVEAKKREPVAAK